MASKPVRITDTTFRDARQSLVATRMRTDTMLPTVERMDQVGFFSLEAWGGATFDVAIRFLNEDPWERIRQLKRHVKRTPLWRRDLSIRCCLTEFRAEPESPRKIIALCINDSTTS